jgi:DnaJ domain
MQFLALGLLALWLLVLVGRGMVRANPARVAAVLRQAGGVASLVAMLLAFLRGPLGLALGLLAFVLWFFAGRRLPDLSAFVRARPDGGGASEAASAWLAMRVDHATGAISGTVLRGRFAGRGLDDMSEPECVALYRDCAAADPRGVRYLDVYLDRRFPGWRQAFDADARDRSGGQGPAARRRGMSEQEAYQVLGIEQGASPDDIGRAHRTLMKKCHPDHGGTADQAARVNEARDVLLRRHR